MPRRFLAPPLELLTADGRFEPVLEAGGVPWRRPVVLLARELCSFELFEPGRAGATDASAAARLHARTSAPFLDPAILVRRAGPAFAIWWWDLDRVGPWLQARFGGARPRVVPESLVQPPGEGWRIVRLTSGFEAQVWRGGALVGSGWRRDPFDAGAWQAFARVQRQALEPAPETPPAARPLPLSGDPGVGLINWTELTSQDLRQAAAIGTAGVLVAATGLFAGQGLHLRALANAQAAQVRALKATAPRVGAASDRQGAQKLAAFRDLAARPSPAAALATALGIARLYDVQPDAFQADASSLSLTLPYSAIDKVDEIAAELEDSGAFADVRPVTDDRAQTIQLQMRLAGSAARPESNPPG